VPLIGQDTTGFAVMQQHLMCPAYQFYNSMFNFPAVHLLPVADQTAAESTQSQAGGQLSSAAGEAAAAAATVATAAAPPLQGSMYRHTIILVLQQRQHVHASTCFAIHHASK
jgi:hypothetical protein